MTPDDATLMAYADGELDAITARRVEEAIADNPALAKTVASHRRLRASVADAFASVLDEPLAARLTDALRTNVVPFPVGRSARWTQAAAIAAALLLGAGLGRGLAPAGPVVTGPHGLVAAGALGEMLDHQLASTAGERRVPVSFRDRAGRMCRVFVAPALDGIACRDGRDWTLVRTRAGAGRAEAGGYVQAGAADPALLSEAQEMMSGEPLNAAAERVARERGWK